MAKLEVIPFKPEHLWDLPARKFEAREMAVLGDVEERVREYQRRGAAYTGVVNGKIVAAAGIFLHWRGVAEVWLVSTELVPKYALSFHRAIKKGLEVFIQALGVWRVQTALHQEHQISRKWLERLGFQDEGKMPGYGPDGGDYVRYARIITLQPSPLTPGKSKEGEQNNDDLQDGK